MDIFFYAGKNDDAGSKLAALVDETLPTGQPNRADNPALMIDLLRARVHSQDIVILHLSTANDLDDFLSAQSLFNDIRLVLILPENDPVLVAKSHQLRPRFIDIAPDHTFDRVMAVLNKMLIPQPNRPKLEKT